MRLPAPIAARAHAADTSQPRAVLGPDHPLVRAAEALDAVVGQALAVLGLLAGSLIVLAAGADWGGALALSSGIVLATLLFVAAAFEQDKRSSAVDLILQGREKLPLAAVRRECQRLTARRTREVLARTLTVTLQDAERRTRRPWPGPHPFVDRRVIVAVAPEVREAVRLLRSDAAPARLVAVTQKLVTDGSSPLYGHSAGELREVLGRALRQG